MCRLDLPAPAVAVRNLIEIAKFGHLCSMMSPMQHRRDGYPFGTVIDIAADGAGVPILCLSPLAIHSRNILENPSCSLVVHMPGWTGLADAMVTIFGDCYPLARDMQASKGSGLALGDWEPGAAPARGESVGSAQGRQTVSSSTRA